MLKNIILAAGLNQPNLVYVGGATGTHSGPNPSIAINSLSGGIASAAASGDLVIVGIANRNHPDPGDVYTPGANWDGTLATYAPGTALTLLAQYSYKRLTAADTSITMGAGFTADHAWVVQVWRNSNASTPIDATTTHTSGTGVPNSPSITTATGSAWVLTLGAAAGFNTDLTVPSGYGFFLHSSQSLLRIGMAAIDTTAAGAIDPPVFGGGNASSTFFAATVAIRPA